VKSLVVKLQGEGVVVDVVEFLTFVLSILFPGACLRCGASLPSADSMPHVVIPQGWPRETLDFLRRDFSIPICRNLRIPARILCSSCWLSLEYVSSSTLVSAGLGVVDSDPLADSVLPSIRQSGKGADTVPLVSPFFTNDTLLELIRFLKFSSGKTAVPSLSWWMAQALSRYLHEIESYVTLSPLVIPVPLHPSRERKRGYNQAALLAEIIARRLDLEFCSAALERTRKTKSQASLDSSMRAGNVSGAFRLSQGVSIEAKDVILVDDLVTTGETVKACMTALREGFPRSIIALSAGRVKGANRF
jgi:ComF family protein